MWGQDLVVPDRFVDDLRLQAELNDAVAAFLEHGTTGNIERMRTAHRALVDRSSR